MRYYVKCAFLEEKKKDLFSVFVFKNNLVRIRFELNKVNNYQQYNIINTRKDIQLVDNQKRTSSWYDTTLTLNQKPHNSNLPQRR